MRLKLSLLRRIVTSIESLTIIEGVTPVYYFVCLFLTWFMCTSTILVIFFAFLIYHYFVFDFYFLPTNSVPISSIFLTVHISQIIIVKTYHHPYLKVLLTK